MIEGDYFPVKMKRKNLEQVGDDFSDFSLSSPATKIRRLDGELAPIIEEEEAEVPIITQSEPDQSSSNNAGAVGGRRGLVIEELPSEPENEERAIVLFKPMNSPIMSSPSNFSVTVDPQFISGFKRKMLWSNHSNPFRDADDEAVEGDKNSEGRDGCMAVVPWMPSQQHFAAVADIPSRTDLCDMMDDEGTEIVAMDVEDQNVDFEQAPVSETGGTNLNEGMHQWQQQHCMIPQPPHNTSTPIVWYR